MRSCKGMIRRTVQCRRFFTFEKVAPYYDFYRPVLLSLRHCKKVLLEGVRVQNSAAWAIHPYFCEDLTIRNLSVFNPYYAQNGDGIDIDSCNRVHMHHCALETGDYGICLKSGKDKEAGKLKPSCENILIHDCKVGHGFGGFVIGSEMSRGVHNVLVKDCMFIETDVGIRFKSAMGRGGVVEDIQMANIRKEAVILSMDYVHNLMDYHDPVVESEEPEDIPQFRNIFFDRCISSDPMAKAAIRPLAGNPDTIRNVYFNASALRIRAKYDSGVRKERFSYQDGECRASFALPVMRLQIDPHVCGRYIGC